MSVNLSGRPALLFLPASRPGAIAKARASAADVVVLDLEDAVKTEDKAAARAGAVAALGEAWPMPVGVRVNCEHGAASPEDCAAVARSAADFVVLPKAESAAAIEQSGALCGKPVAAMIETPRAVLELRSIVAASGLAGLIAGTNDLSAELRLPPGAGRGALQYALQAIVCAARAARVAAWDGVYNALDDADGLAEEARAGRVLGFDGKSLIHPDQIAPCRLAFAPADDEVARAERLIAAATGGAERFEGQMIEELHVAAARRLLDRR